LNLFNRIFPLLPFYDLGLFAPNATGSVYWIWLAALPLSQVLFNHELRKISKVLLGAFVLLTIYVAIGPGLTWASGWVPLVAVFAVLLGLKSPRLLIPVALIVALIVVMNSDTLLNEFWLGLSHEHYSANTRVAAWEVVLQIAGKNPVWGLGPSNYYYYTPLYTLLGYRVQFNSHSQYVDLIAQVGVLGLFFFLWFMVAIGRLALQLNRRVHSGFAKAYTYGAFAAVIAMLVTGILGDWLIPFLYNITLGGFRSSVIGWTLLGALVAMKWEFPDEVMADSAESEPSKPPN
jgi:O-antigen ligase